MRFRSVERPIINVRSRSVLTASRAGRPSHLPVCREPSRQKLSSFRRYDGGGSLLAQPSLIRGGGRLAPTPTFNNFATRLSFYFTAHLEAFIVAGRETDEFLCGVFKLL
ncbi:hypothetical protein J6590_022575 [Homalodisca vitripennis]|nr:hypothetical protein J6590_022575 [Homalodisca vitripennis]